MQRELADSFLEVAEVAAIACAPTIGKGDKHLSDKLAVEAMRDKFNTLKISGRIVIGEGERDAAPMLYIGELLGRGGPEADIAVDPLEGTNLCAKGFPGAITVLAASEYGGLLHAPDMYMQKIVVGARSKGVVDIEAPIEDNLYRVARSLERRVEDLAIMMLDRPRHEALLKRIRRAGAQVHLITDGDLSAGISAAYVGSEIDMMVGSGGAPEGVITAAAMRCLNGEMQAKFMLKDQLVDPEDQARIPDDVVDRMQQMGISDPYRVYTERELAPGNAIIFAATGVTRGEIMKGVRFFNGGVRTHSLVMSCVDEAKVVELRDRTHINNNTTPVKL